ncbi:hypothetical protein GGI25_003411 [Coemansia spiralis]|uniref:Pentatricopeptide repeat-containing protein n=2 Tax=Coemansia TaxID=4863 RepID=A0A9W8KXK2_9FUNG|nr:hypothetical protein EDC05_001669 [Coemansia umbellata]KAJ2621219.1 hypothetical protein GGI26_004292 [Coemansia sp. RSA 1358]KAJ2676766.1 hypothetical protein GGI25_003411 [Coemansia spiralis]
MAPIAKTDNGMPSKIGLINTALKDMMAETKSERAMESDSIDDKYLGKRANKVESRLFLRQALSQKLEREAMDQADSLELTAVDSVQEDIAAPIRRHILVREFMAILRRLDTHSFTSADLNGMVGTSDFEGLVEARCEAETVVLAAWSHYCKIKAHSNAEVLTRQIPMSAICLLVTELTFMPGSHDYHQRFERVVQIFNDFSSFGRSIKNPVQFGMYLRALNKLGRYKLVIKEAELYFEHEGHIIASPALLMGIKRQVITAYFSGNRPDKAIEVFRNLKADEKLCNSITPHVYSAILTGALNSKHISNITLFSYVEDMLDLICKHNYTSASRTGLLNELLQSAYKTANSDFFFHTFERFLVRNIKINYTTFGILLHFSCSSYAADARQLHHLYRRIVDSKTNWEIMTQHIFAIFISSFVRLGRIDYAISVLEDLRAHPKAQLTSMHFSVLFSHYAEFGMAQHALELYHTMTNIDKLHIPWSVWINLVKAIRRSSDFNYSNDGSPASGQREKDELLVNIIKHGQRDSMQGMFDSFFKLRGLDPGDVFAFAALFAGAFNMAAKDAWRSGMDPQSTLPENDMYFKDEAWRFKLVSHLRQALRCLIDASGCLSVPQDLYNSAIATFAILHDYESAQQLYDHMTYTEAMEPSASTFNVLLQAFVRGSDTTTATQILERARTNNIPLNQITANALIHGYLVANKPFDAIKVYSYVAGRPLPLLENTGYNDFVASGSVDIYTVVLLVSGLVDAGMVKEAIVIFEDAFFLLRTVPNRLLAMLVNKLEEKLQFDIAQLCLKRYSKRVDDNNYNLQPMHAISKLAEPVNTPNRFPVSYFQYLVDQTDDES